MDYVQRVSLIISTVNLNVNTLLTSIILKLFHAFDDILNIADEHADQPFWGFRDLTRILSARTCIENNNRYHVAGFTASHWLNGRRVIFCFEFSA